MRIPIYQVDAFTDKPFAGNPAAVCLLEAWPEDSLLQAIAAENNLSETAFLVKREKSYELRWLTPVAEVDLCGHATLASAYVIFNHVDPALHNVTFDTRSGELSVRREGDLLCMDFPALPAAPCACPAALLDGLGIQPGEVLRSTKYLAVFDTEEEVRMLQPNMDALKKLDLMGVIVTAKGTTVDFVSRFFAPKVGVPEDPVTGSAHCVLTPYWAQRLDRNKLHARQISLRGGDLYCELLGDRVVISGRAAMFLKGEITLGLVNE